MLMQYNDPLVLTHLQLLGKVFEYSITAKAGVVGSISTPESIIMTTIFELLIKASWLAKSPSTRGLSLSDMSVLWDLAFPCFETVVSTSLTHSLSDGEDIRAGRQHFELCRVRFLAPLAIHPTLPSS
jgi:hypothetical protein